MNIRSVRTVTAAALQGLALAALVAGLLGATWLDPRSRPRVLLLVDRSDSMPRSAVDQTLAAMQDELRVAGAGEVQQIEFAARPSRPFGPGEVPATPPDTRSTNLELALQAALAAHADAPFDGAVIVSDGQAHQGDSLAGLQAVRAAGLPLQWLAIARPPPPAHLAQVLAPGEAPAGALIRLSVQLAGPQAGRQTPPWQVEATARSAGGNLRRASADVDAGRQATLDIEAPGRGAVVVDLLLRDTASGAVVDTLPDAAVVDVVPNASLLVVQGSAGPLAASLRGGGWRLEVVPASRLAAQADALAGYAAVVLDDVAIADADTRFWQALVDAVRQRGLGLMVLGGERSFARGGYRDSILESVLPVRSQPAALDRPVSVLFAVDKSGSMGEGSAGVDRFQLARQAVIAAAQGLSARDSAGLLLFDTTATTVVPLAPASAANAALAHDWRARPNGGTRLQPALEAAAAELARAPAGRRLLVLVTDGFVDDAALPGLRERLATERIETLALAIGPDADDAALQRALGGDASVLSVDQVAELPRLMASGLERRRSRVERGRIAVEQRLPLPFADGWLTDWPPVAAHAVTQAQPDARVALASRSGEPVIALQAAGTGRVVAVTSGLGDWTPQWLGWPAWSRLAGGLTGWVASPPTADRLTVTDQPDGLVVDIELASGTSQPDRETVRLTVDTPMTAAMSVSAEPVAPGRLQARVPDAGDGLYTIVLGTPGGTRRWLHLRHARSEARTWGVSTDVDRWRRDASVGDWHAGRLLEARGSKQPVRPLDRSLMALALLLFGVAILVDRAPSLAAPWRTALGRWRDRA